MVDFPDLGGPIIKQTFLLEDASFILFEESGSHYKKTCHQPDRTSLVNVTQTGKPSTCDLTPLIRVTRRRLSLSKPLQ